MKRYISFLFLLFTITLTAQLQSPSEFLGYEIGTQFSRHADVVRYFEHVAANSDMVTYASYGKTYERRPLTYAIVSSPQNMANLENIRKDNLKNAGLESGSASPNIAIVWLSYNVHGNEASSTEASMNTIYKLITENKAWLQNTVVIIDPCINPDGRDRYANWYNSVKSTPYNALQEATEHNEPWPGGRANHYLFDLNRDWAWLTQIESQQRLKVYNQWMPHVHVDFHEQGINSPYYFAPAAEPFHEIISPWQRDFQTQIGKNHAKYFDKEGWLFFTRESFDLLYPSYGDTYPTFMGSIGMTYEQAGHGAAGLGVNTDEGYELTLVDRVAHHTTTGLSTIEISSMNAAKLNTEFKKFFDNSSLKYKSYVLKGNADKINALTKLLDQHEIKYGYASGGKVSGFNFGANKDGSMDSNGALVVSTNQPKGKMVKVLFEPDAKLSDPLTYDITAWSVPHAYGLETVASTTLVTASGSKPQAFALNIMVANSPGYIAKWNSLNDAGFLAELLQNNIKVRFSEKDLSFSGTAYPKGSLVITRSDNKNNASFDETVIKIANAHQRKLFASPTSFSDNGTDFGSGNIKLVNKQRVAILKGDGVSSLSYGAIWHFFEQQLKYPLTSIDTDDFGYINIRNFDVLILPEGWYQSLLNETNLNKIKDWVRDGGKVIAMGRAVNSFEGKEGFDLKKNEGDKKEEDKDTVKGNLIPYDQRERESVKDFITGSIYKVTLDPSHPMAFGYGDTYFSLKQGNNSFAFLENGYNVGYIKDEPISVSGFSGSDAKAGLKNSVVFGEARIGRGSFIYLVDDVLFRSFWENGKLFLVNSVFFVNNNKYILD
ncbi:zinc carboxypeptidase [Ulvibacter sp. MAR_2010_11]|uniref:M14 metallopeptidase family protein n=1 Tax=Ulvibacter sp. MAR_2010_11 TaxID=1250229 RepID=UPI000C2C3AFE|nr:M14 metallopeptidase family protein [Ulvibacter sp. MAR_2010_11]PKA83713.1 zinc carboxypeptidase [Ulvibacter sp. MAR_2010_11]